MCLNPQNTIAVLLRYGANGNALSYTLGAVNGFTPADLASMHNHSGIAAYLSETHLAQGLSKLQLSDDRGSFRKRNRNRPINMSQSNDTAAEEEVSQHMSCHNFGITPISLGFLMRSPLFHAAFPSRVRTAPSGSSHFVSCSEGCREDISRNGVWKVTSPESGPGDCTWHAAGIAYIDMRVSVPDPTHDKLFLLLTLKLLVEFWVETDCILMVQEIGMNIAAAAPDLDLAVNRVEAIVHNPGARMQYMKMREAADRNQVC